MRWLVLFLVAVGAETTMRTTCADVKRWYNTAGVSGPCCARAGGRPTDAVDVPYVEGERAVIVFEGKSRTTFPQIHLPHSVRWDTTNTTAVVTIPDLYTVSAFLGRAAALNAHLFAPKMPLMILYASRDTSGLVPNGVPYVTVPSS